MKKIYLLFFLLITIPAFTQPAVKLYGYAQPVTPGTIPVGEDGRPIPREPIINYFIYAAYSRAYSLKFAEVWIKGKSYSIQASPVTSTPVTITNDAIPSKPVITTLVPATKLKVISLQPVAPSGIISKASWLKDMLKRNELVVSYFYKGKKYFIALKKLKQLPPFMGM